MTHINHKIQNWQPWMIYTWTKRDLQSWFDSHGSFAFYNGEAWTPKSKSLGAGRYEIRFVKYQG